MYTKIMSFFGKIKHLDLIFIFLLFITAFLLRAYLINKNLFLGFEQGRDLLVVKDIVENHKLVLIGPKTDIAGIFHGPLFYYLLTIPFVLSTGSPLFISLFLIFINSLSIYFVYLLGKELFDKKIGLISAVILTFSFGAIVMSRWLSNPPLTVPVSCLFFLFLARFLQGKKYYLLLVAVFWGIAGQTEFINYFIFGVIMFLVTIMFIKNFLKTPKIITFISILLLVVTSVTNYILFDLRHNFLITNSFIGLLTKNKGFYATFKGAFSSSVNGFANFYKDTIMPFGMISVIIIFVLSILTLFTYFKTKKSSSLILSLWIFSPVLMFILLKYPPLYHYFAAVTVGIIILTALFVNKVWEINKLIGVVFLILITVLNLFVLFSNLPTNKNVFFESTQPDLKYSDEISVINRIYKEANKQPFSFQSYTIPYWQQQGWEYLFWYYGNKLYGYLPVSTAKKLFVIIQNDPNNTEYQKNWLKNTVTKWGKKELEFKYGALTVEMLNTK